MRVTTPHKVLRTKTDGNGVSVAKPARREPGRSVATTWTYTLGSIVVVMVALSTPLLFAAAEDYARSHAAVDAAVLLLVFVGTAFQLRYCWFLQVGRGGGLPRPAWTVAVLAPAAASWVLGVVASGVGLRTALPLWMALCLIACLLPVPQRWVVCRDDFGQWNWLIPMLPWSTGCNCSAHHSGVGN